MSVAVMDDHHGPVRDPDIIMASPDTLGDCLKGREEPHLAGAITQELSSIMATSSIVSASALSATSSNSASPGSSCPPLDQPKPYSFTPPSRPSSTPFPLHDHRSPTSCHFDGTITGSRSQQGPDQAHGAPAKANDTNARPSLLGLPQELQEVIIDHIFGYRISVAAKSRTEMYVKKWSKAPRYARRRELADLALVSPVWRDLVQERLFQHIRLKGDETTFYDAAFFFQLYPHLQGYVRHLEVWFPVFSTVYLPSMADRVLPVQPASYQYRSPSPAYAATLHDVFSLVAYLLTNVVVLTIEGGDRKKAPQVRHVRPGVLDVLPSLPSVETLVTRGQWNLMRADRDFERVLSALPNLKEWQGAYDKPKSKSYLAMACLLPSIPANLTSLHLVMEPDYRREYTVPLFFVKVTRQLHFCNFLALPARQLEHLCFTGRVCPTFFNELVANSDPRYSKLRSIDITLKNNCHPFSKVSDTGSGIHEPHFIERFEELVLAAVRALPKLPLLQHLRIRFVDLGMFHLYGRRGLLCFHSRAIPAA